MVAASCGLFLGGCGALGPEAAREDSGLEIGYARTLDGDNFLLPAPAGQKFRVSFEIKNTSNRPWNIFTAHNANAGPLVYLVDNENRAHAFRIQAQGGMTTLQPGKSLPFEFEIGNTAIELPEGPYRVFGAYEQNDGDQPDVYTGKVMGSEGAWVHVVDNLNAKKNRVF